MSAAPVTALQFEFAARSVPEYLRRRGLPDDVEVEVGGLAAEHDLVPGHGHEVVRHGRLVQQLEAHGLGVDAEGVDDGPVRHLAQDGRLLDHVQLRGRIPRFSEFVN